MPELPEVETVRLDLRAVLLGKKIKSLFIVDFKNIFPSLNLFKKKLLGKTIVDIERKGKLLIFKLNDLNLLVHLKMTGQLIYQDIVGGHSLSNDSREKAVGGKLPNRFTRAYFVFNDDSTLYFNDLRKFAYLKIVDNSELSTLLQKNYGLEPLSPSFDQNYLLNLAAKHRINIKALLLNQQKIAGLGNIYVDEALFLSRILPFRPANSLKKKEVSLLFEAINEVISKAIKNKGTTFNTFVDAKGKVGNYSQYLKVYGRPKQACLVCKTEIKKMKLAGRGTHYCPQCQR